MDAETTQAEEQPVRKFSFLAFLIAVGCQSTKGPIENRRSGIKPDPMTQTLEEQERYGRGRYPIIIEDRKLLPPTLSDQYGPTGR